MPDFQKQTVQWFPGHMAKTRRIIKENLKLVDGVCEIVDARVPESSRNPELDKLIERKPRIVLLNKADLADENATARKIKELKQKGIVALAVDCRSGRGLDRSLLRFIGFSHFYRFNFWLGGRHGGSLDFLLLDFRLVGFGSNHRSWFWLGSRLWSRRRLRFADVVQVYLA